MKKLNNPFLDKLPLCDLHGEIRETVPIILNNFIEEQLILKQTKFIVMHGIGEGVVKEACYDHLKQNKHVKDFYLEPTNAGITIVNLKPKS